jgi:HD-GYP domain-containing protein (c-di-GMP phosphodiesterase class II)
MTTKTPKNKAETIEKISRDQALISGDIETALNKIGQVCTKTLNIEEVTFWQFTQNGENLTCIASHKVGQKSPVKTKLVRTQLVKDYVKSIQNGLYMVALDSSHKAAKSASQFLRQEIKASLHVPIYISGALSGVVQFNKIKGQRDWNLSDCVFACQATDLTADTLQNFGMKGNEKYVPDIMETLDRTLDHVLKELNLEYGMIRLDEIPITREYSPEIEMEFVNQYRLSPEFTYRTTVVTNVNQATGDSRNLVQVLKSAGIKSFVTVPITMDTYQTGCIHVASLTLMDWDQETISLLEWTARHIAHVVNDIWVRQDNRTLNGLIQSSLDNTHTLNRMMLFDEAVRMVGESATDVLETDMAFIVLSNPDGTTSCPWINGLNPDTINRIIDTEGASIQTILRHSKTPILFPDIRKSVLPTSLQRHLVEKKARSTRIFPLVYEGQTMGAVLGFYKQVRLFTRNERSILSLFANSATLTLQNAWMYDQVKQGYLGLALALANAEDARETIIPGSSMRSAKLAEETARALKVPEEEIMSIHWAALLHDIGKKDIPEDVLQKSGPLNENEWKMVRLSPHTGEQMLESIPQLHGMAKIIRNFREHYDGSGYPDRLKGNQIPIGAKVLAVTDAYTSMLDKRAYRASRLPQEALQEIQRYSGKYFDPVVVDAFNNVAKKHTG